MTDSANTAAQKVVAAFLTAALTGHTTRQQVAAAIRAAADEVKHHWDGMECVDYLCSIAAELENPQP